MSPTSQCKARASLASLGGEELAHAAGAQIIQHAFGHLDAVVCWMLVKPRMAQQGTSFRLPSAKYHPLNSCVYECTNTHQTRFDGDIKHTARQAVITLSLRPMTQGDDFRVGCWITACNRLIKALTN